MEGNDPYGGHGQVCEGEGGVKLLCFMWLSLFLKLVWKRFPRITQSQAIFSVDVVWVHFKFSSFPDESTHIENSNKHVRTKNWASSWLFTRNIPRTRSEKRSVQRLTFRHRASCLLGEAFHCSPENAFYIFNQQIYFII